MGTGESKTAWLVAIREELNEPLAVAVCIAEVPGSSIKPKWSQVGLPTKGPKPFLFDKIKLLTVSENFFRWLLSKLESDYKRSRFSGSDRDFPAGLRNRNKWDEEVSASAEKRMFRRSDLATKRNFSALSQFFQEENFLMVKSCSGSAWRGSWGW